MIEELYLAKKPSEDIYHLKKANLWVTLSGHFCLDIWELKLNLEKKVVFKHSIKAHNEQITGCLEIGNHMTIASSSLDGTIRIWDLEEYKMMGEFQGKRSNMSIKKILYTPDYGGMLLSLGFHNIIFIWSPDSTLTKSHVGKLEGHQAIVKDCQYAEDCPNCISIDE